MEKEYCIVSTTVDSETAVHTLADTIIENRLAACAQISGPLKSIYWWNNQKEQAVEWTCSFKTTMDIYPKLKEMIQELHPYDVPEIILTPILDGNQEYLNWVGSETR